MKWITIGVFLLLVAGAGIFLASQGGSREKAAPTASASAAPGQAVGNTSSQAGEYLDYSEEVLAQTSGKRALFFHAPWCPQCRSIEASIKEQGVPDGWTVIKVDYDSNQGLRQKYSVKQQTTFVKLDGSGNGTDTYVAYEKPTIDAVEQNFLSR